MGKEKWKGGGETKREASGGANFSSSLEKITKGLADSLINHDPTPPASSSISSRRRLPKAVALPRLFTATFVLGDRPPCRWPWEIGGPSPCDYRPTHLVRQCPRLPGDHSWRLSRTRHTPLTLASLLQQRLQLRVQINVVQLDCQQTADRWRLQH